MKSLNRYSILFVLAGLCQAIEPLAIAAFVSSCSGPSQEEAAIADYIQTIDGSKLDLSFEALETSKTGVYSANDSAQYLRLMLKSISDSRIPGLKTDIYADTLKLMRAQGELRQNRNHAMNRKYYTEQVAQITKEISETRDQIVAYRSNFQGTPYEDVYKRMVSYQGDTATVFYQIYHCRYKVLNPLINTTQELKGKFYLTPDLSKVQTHEKINL